MPFPSLVSPFLQLVTTPTVMYRRSVSSEMGEMERGRRIKMQSSEIAMGIQDDSSRSPAKAATSPFLKNTPSTN